MEVLLIVFFATGKPGRHDKRRSQKTCLCNYDFDLQDYGFESKYFYNHNRQVFQGGGYLGESVYYLACYRAYLQSG